MICCLANCPHLAWASGSCGHGRGSFWSYPAFRGHPALGTWAPWGRRYWRGRGTRVLCGWRPCARGTWRQGACRAPPGPGRYVAEGDRQQQWYCRGRACNHGHWMTRRGRGSCRVVVGDRWMDEPSHRPLGEDDRGGRVGPCGDGVHARHPPCCTLFILSPRSVANFSLLPGPWTFHKL